MKPESGHSEHTLWQKLFPPQASLSLHEIVGAVVMSIAIIGLDVWISRSVVPAEFQVFLAASMGASTVLVAVLYHSPLSQPWAVIGGNLVGAGVGLACAALIDQPALASALAVGLTVLLQLLLRCLHAPGGGTALMPILSSAVFAEGIVFVGIVLVNTVIIVLAALLFNNLLQGRRYPMAFVAPATKPVFTETELREAIDSLDGFIDVTEADLELIYERALAHLKAQKRKR